MKNNLNKTKKIFSISLLIFFLLIEIISCQSDLVSNTPLPTETRSLTATPVSSQDSTLSLAEKEEMNFELYEADNCELPCWWGIIPGETDWLKAQQALNPLASEIHILAKESEADQNFVVVAYFPVLETLSEVKVLEQSFRIDDGKIVIVQPEIPNRLPRTIISEVLKNYGQPSEVWIETYGYSPGEIDPFRLVLFYPDKGILVRYFDDGDFQNDYVIGCFAGYTGAIVLWAPELELNFAEALNGINALGTYGEQYYKPLEETTEMDLETFYKTFLDPNTDICIETPAELWMDK